MNYVIITFLSLLEKSKLKKLMSPAFKWIDCSRNSIGSCSTVKLWGLIFTTYLLVPVTCWTLCRARCFLISFLPVYLLNLSFRSCVMFPLFNPLGSSCVESTFLPKISGKWYDNFYRHCTDSNKVIMMKHM